MIYSPLEQFSVLSLWDFSLDQGGGLLSLIEYNLFLWIDFVLNNFPLIGEPFIKYLGLYSFFRLISDLCSFVGTGFQALWDFTNLSPSGYWTNLYFNNSLNGINAISSLWPALDTAANSSINVSSKSYSLSLVSGWNSLGFTSYLALISFFNICLENIYMFVLGDVFQWTEATNSFSCLIFSLSTSSLWLSLAFVFTVFLFLACTNKVSLISRNRWQTLVENYYEIVFNVVNDSAGASGIKFFPLIFTVFTIILICNLLGMIPYSFTVTSHLIVTFSMALAIFLGINALGILKNGRHFLSLFFPPGAPLGLAPLLVAIEWVSYVFRVLSLAIRLFANLMSGHTLLKILSGFAWSAVSIFGIFLLPLGVILLVTGLEVAIACLQAYIFSVLLCIYINDAFNLH